MGCRARARMRVPTGFPSPIPSPIPMLEAMRIVGIDPGLARVGIGVLDVLSPSELRNPNWCTIETKAGIPASERLCEIHGDLSAFLRETKPSYAVLERLFLTKNERTAMDVAQARGVILLTLAEHAIPVLEPTPLELKAAITGDGHADKIQIQTMLMRMFHLPDPPKPDDAADALALAVFGALSVKPLTLIA